VESRGERHESKRGKLGMWKEKEKRKEGKIIIQWVNMMKVH
jgi:hypothetical protein